ncbi:hypothetical protein NMY22_g8637 [Coprinellus aureogranulatus]|nr:hypothetical protein NMY22_g8637 [Coprinellus aureogranulatus]
MADVAWSFDLSFNTAPAGSSFSDLTATTSNHWAMSSLVVPHELTELERDAVVAHLKCLRESGVRSQDLRTFECSLPGKPPLFVKQAPDVLAEASTQHFFHVLSNADKTAPGVPKVFDAFVSQDGAAFMVMEKVEAPTLSECGISEEEAIEHAAFAVKWLLDQLPSVPKECFGRISSEAVPAMHTFFQDHQAPRIYDPDSLARLCMNAVSLSTFIVGRKEFLEPFKESRAIYHADIKKDNFLLDSSGKVYIIDFQHIGVFPEVFQNYAFFASREPLGREFARKLGYEPSKDLNLMGKFASTIVMSSKGGDMNWDSEAFRALQRKFAQRRHEA